MQWVEEFAKQLNALSLAMTVSFFTHHIEIGTSKFVMFVFETFAGFPERSNTIHPEIPEVLS